ncbi:MAG: RNA polymerase sigma factor RpoE [Gammaproteobacteria bacterium]|nr:RNA polymerase sigma factor RpoE [Gammaproteobacteria bacterium]
MIDQQTDVDLVRRTRRGEQAAFNLLVLKYQHRVSKLVARFIHDSYEVEDVVQEAFIKAYRAIGNFRGDSAFYTWLYRIAVNTAKNHLVNSGRRPPGTDMDFTDVENMAMGSPLAEIATPEKCMLADEIARTVQDVIGGLPEELRIAISLREFEGLSYDDIAGLMDCPVGTVRSRIFRAREAIDEKLRPLLA